MNVRCPNDADGAPEALPALTHPSNHGACRCLYAEKLFSLIIIRKMLLCVRIARARPDARTVVVVAAVAYGMQRTSGLILLMIFQGNILELPLYSGSS
jgi:hypothetical protein